MPDLRDHSAFKAQTELTKNFLILYLEDEKSLKDASVAAFTNCKPDNAVRQGRRVLTQPDLQSLIAEYRGDVPLPTDEELLRYIWATILNKETEQTSRVKLLQLYLEQRAALAAAKPAENPNDEPQELAPELEELIAKAGR